METELWEILVPTVMNGKPIRTRYHRVWDKSVREIANGLTILTPAKGQWIDADGETIHEKMIPVRIACTEDQIKHIANFTIGYYGQDAVMYYRISSYCVIAKKASGRVT